MDQTLLDMIESAVDEPPDRERLDQVVGHLQHVDVSSLPLWQRAHTLGFLKKTVIDLADKNQHFDPETQYIKSEFYADSIAQIVKLSKSLAYSPAMDQWLSSRRRLLAETLGQLPRYVETRRDWNELPQQTKLNFLQGMAEKMMRIYLRELPAAMPTVITGAEDHGITAGLLWGNNAQKNALNVVQPEIAVSDEALDTFISATRSIIHEGTHLACLHLADFHTRDVLKTSHPAYHDASIKALLLYHNATGVPIIPDMYRADSEEALASRHEIEFLHDRARCSRFLGTRFHQAVHDVGQGLKDIGAKVAPIFDHFRYP